MVFINPSFVILMFYVSYVFISVNTHCDLYENVHSAALCFPLLLFISPVPVSLYQAVSLSLLFSLFSSKPNSQQTTAHPDS